MIKRRGMHGPQHTHFSSFLISSSCCGGKHFDNGTLLFDFVAFSLHVFLHFLLVSPEITSQISLLRFLVLWLASGGYQTLITWGWIKNLPICFTETDNGTRRATLCFLSMNRICKWQNSASNYGNVSWLDAIDILALLQTLSHAS